MSQPRAHAILSRLFVVEEINGAHRCPTYMYRWLIVSTRWFKVYIHRFVADDWSLDMHDHPKRFVSIGLWGRYREHRMEPIRVEDSYHGGPIVQLCEATVDYRAPWFRTFAATHIHRITLEPGAECWTLVIVGRPVRSWGFWHQGEFWPWREYVAPENEVADQMKACD